MLSLLFNLYFRLTHWGMMMEQESSPVKFRAAKKIKLFHTEDCIICNGRGGNLITNSASSASIQSIIHTAQSCQDEVYDRLQDVCDTSSQFSYHRLCLQKYTSKTNVKHRQTLNEIEEPTFQRINVGDHLTCTRSSKPII